MANGEPLFPSADIAAAALAHMGNDTPAPSVESPAPATQVGPTPRTAQEVAAAKQSVTQPQETAPVVPGTEAAAPAAAAAPTPVALDPTAFYTVTTKVNGVEKTEVITGAEVQARNMNHRSYTQNQQALREQQRQVLAERQQIQQFRNQAAEQQAILNDPGRLAAYIQGKFPHLTIGQAQQAAAQAQANAGITPQQPVQPQFQQQPPLDPQALANLQDVQSAVAHKAAEMEAELGRRLTAAETQTLQRIEERATEIAQRTTTEVIGKLQTAHAVAGYNRQIDNHIASLTDQHPQLKAVPELNDVLRFRVAQMNPQTAQEMLDGLNEVANAIAEEIDSHYREAQSTVLAQKAKLVTNGMERTAGVAPTAPTPASSKPFVNNGKGDWGSLGAEVLNRLNFGG